MRPLPGLDVPVVDPKTGQMTQAWYEYFQSSTIGKYLTSGIVHMPLSSGVNANVTSLVLPPGDWELLAPTQFQGVVTTTVTETQCSLTTTSLFMDNTVGNHDHWRGNTADFLYIMCPGPFRTTITVPTTYFLVAQAIFSGGTYEAAGEIVARRI